MMSEQEVAYKCGKAGKNEVYIAKRENKRRVIEMNKEFKKVRDKCKTKQTEENHFSVFICIQFFLEISKF